MGILDAPALIPKITGKPGGQGCYIFGGRMAYQITSAGITYEFVMELPCAALDVGSVQVITGASRASSSPGAPGMFIDVKAIGALSDLDGAWSSVTTVAWAGSGAIQLTAAASTATRAFQISNWASLTPVSRTDGGTRALVACRIYMGSGNVATLGNGGSDVYSNWSSRAAGLVRLRNNSTAGDQRTSTSNWATVNTSPVIGFAYSTRKPTIQVASFGDSITEGRGTYLQASFGLVATESLNDLDLKSQFSHINLGWSGQTMAQIRQNLLDACVAGIVPDIAIIPNGSPNNISTTISSSDIITMRRTFVEILGICGEYGIKPLIWTWMPSNTSVKNYGSTDSLRVDYNTETIAMAAANGMVLADLSTAISGVTSGGQVQMVAGSTDDGIHPNDTGIDLCVPLIEAALRKLTQGII